jgi:hypothetical protein
MCLTCCLLEEEPGYSLTLVSTSICGSLEPQETLLLENREYHTTNWGNVDTMACAYIGFNFSALVLALRLV